MLVPEGSVVSPLPPLSVVFVEDRLQTLLGVLQNEGVSQRADLVLAR
jgi:hypothetical protein